MIRRLRLKFVAICMALVTLVLAVVFCSIHAAMQQNIELLSQQVLRRVIEENVVGMKDQPHPDPRPDIGITVDGDFVLLPYFTLDIWGDVAYVTGGTYADLEDTAALHETREQVQSDINEKLVYVAYIDDEVVGSVRAEFVNDETVYLSRFGVSTKYQNLGIGKQYAQQD